MNCLSVVCLSEGSLGGDWGFSVCGISTYKQVKFLGRILQHFCGNSFSFLKGLKGGLGGPGGLSEGDWIMVYEYGYEKRMDHITESEAEVKIQFF